MPAILGRARVSHTGFAMATARVPPLFASGLFCFMSTPAISPIDGASQETADARSALWFVGALPPPLNGQSNCNRAMLEAFATRNAALRLHDIGGTNGSKLRGVVRAITALALRSRRRDRAYLSIPGQNGVWLFAPLVLLLRLCGIVHYVHHHSFRPINAGPARAMRLLVACGGHRQRHILLSPDMRRRFTDMYLRGDDARSASLSNAYLFGPNTDTVPDRPNRPVTLGHMSVLTREKGVSYLLQLFAGLLAQGHDWCLVLAGPCADPALRAEIDAAVAAHPGHVEYRGALEGADKERFFADIDLFVLATTLVDEAEPLVMLEAFARGVDVVASDTGCIRDRIRTPQHLLALEFPTDIALIKARISDAAMDWSAVRGACVDHVRSIKAAADREARALFPQLVTVRLFASNGSPVT